MLRCVKAPAVTYDLVGLANQGVVTIGRETDSLVRLDSPDIPFLLSRKHATVQVQPDGRLLLHDLGSTNGTYAARPGQMLTKLPVDKHWELRDNDSIGFGGPDTIVVGGNHVANPFIFRYYAAADTSTATAGATDLLAQVDQRNPRTRSASARRQQRVDEEDSDVVILSSPLRATRSEGSAIEVVEVMDDQPNNQEVGHVGTSTPASPSRSPSVMKDILATHLSCPICQDWLVAAHALTCGHMFCGLCLVTWLNQNQSCPSCRKLVMGVPVRCFQVDSAIQDIVEQGVKMMSPGTRNERSQKQRHWDNVQNIVVPDWAMSLQQRKRKAAEAAARNQSRFMHPAEAPNE